MYLLNKQLVTLLFYSLSSLLLLLTTTTTATPHHLLSVRQDAGCSASNVGAACGNGGTCKELSTAPSPDEGGPIPLHYICAGGGPTGETVTFGDQLQNGAHWVWCTLTGGTPHPLIDGHSCG